MKKNNNQSININAWLDEQHGKEGTESRAKFDEESYSYYYGEILKNRRKEISLMFVELWVLFFQRRNRQPLNEEN